MSKPGQTWDTHIDAIRTEAESVMDAGDTFAPHNGATSDLNLHAADMLAGPDPSADPCRGR